MLAKKILTSKFLRLKPHCNIGTIGHVDHGKTTLQPLLPDVYKVLVILYLKLIMKLISR